MTVSIFQFSRFSFYLENLTHKSKKIIIYKKNILSVIFSALYHLPWLKMFKQIQPRAVFVTVYFMIHFIAVLVSKSNITLNLYDNETCIQSLFYFIERIHKN